MDFCICCVVYMEYMLSTLNELAIKHGTDKSSLCHDYCDEYDIFLNKYRDKKVNVLEFGVFYGSSIKMWLEYFYNGNVYGVDIANRELGISDDRYKFICGDQTDDNLYKKLDDIDFDIVIDDASHECGHQVYAFERIFPKLKSGALYIVEDTCTSYWNYGGDINFIEYSKRLIDDVNYNGIYCDSSINVSNARGRDYLDKTLLKNGSQKRYDIKSMYCSNSFIIFFKK